MSEEAKATPYVATVEEGPAYWQVGILWVMLATGEQTGGEYSLMWELCPKGSGATPHYHDQDEQFYVIDGEITYLANGEELKAKAGSFVLIPRRTVHSFRVDSETATLLNSYTPAGFERTITELAEPAQARTIPPAARPWPPTGKHSQTFSRRSGCTLYRSLTYSVKAEERSERDDPYQASSCPRVPYRR